MILSTYVAGNASLQVKECKKKLKHEDIMQKPFSKADKRKSTHNHHSGYQEAVQETNSWGATVSKANWNHILSTCMQ